MRTLPDRRFRALPGRLHQVVIKFYRYDRGALRTFDMPRLNDRGKVEVRLSRHVTSINIYVRVRARDWRRCAVRLVYADDAMLR